jgi:hypothetical protein
MAIGRRAHEDGAGGRAWKWHGDSRCGNNVAPACSAAFDMRYVSRLNCGRSASVHFWREARRLDRACLADTRRPLPLARHCPQHPPRGISLRRRPCRVDAPDGNAFRTVSARAVCERLRTERRAQITRRCICGGPVVCIVYSGVGRALRLDGSGRIPDARRNPDWTTVGVMTFDHALRRSAVPLDLDESPPLPTQRLDLAS